MNVLPALTAVLLLMGLHRTAEAAEMTCVVGAHPRELDAWAEYVATLTCDGLRDRGVAIGKPVPNVDGVKADYTVTLSRDGDAFSLTVVAEAPPARRTLSAHLNSLDEGHLGIRARAHLARDGRRREP